MNGKQTRDTKTRSAVKRPANYLPPNAMPMNIDLGPDVKVRWIRKFINGAEEDKQSFFRRASRGWTPVTPEEVPHLTYLKDQNGNIANSGCILCKIDADIVAQDVSYYEDQALGALASAQAEYESNDRHVDIPKFSEGGKSRVIRGRAPSY